MGAHRDMRSVLRVVRSVARRWSVARRPSPRPEAEARRAPTRRGTGSL